MGCRKCDRLAPWCAERAGLIESMNDTPNLNENIYQTTGAISGFWGGFFLPAHILAKIYGED